MDGASFTDDPTVTRFFYLKYATSYAITSSMVLILHDYTMTFSQEVELIWCSPWSLPKTVYLANRYISLLIGYAYMFALFFAEHTAARCALLDQLHVWYGWFSTVIVQLVLQVWLYAIFNRSSRQWLYWISFGYVLLAGVACGTLLPYVSNVRFFAVKPVCIDVNTAFQPSSSLKADITRLNAQPLPRIVLGITMSWAGYSVLLLALLVSRVCTVFRARPCTGDGIAFVLFRDTTLYCATLLGLILLNVFMVLFVPYALYQVGFGYAVVLPNILSSRILLDLRESERRRADRVDVHGVAVEQWETMFHIT